MSVAPSDSIFSNWKPLLDITPSDFLVIYISEVEPMYSLDTNVTAHMEHCQSDH